MRRNPEFRSTRNPEPPQAKPGTSTRNPESTKPGIIDQTKPGTGPNETQNPHPKPRIHEILEFTQNETHNRPERDRPPARALTPNPNTIPRTLTRTLTP